MADVLTLADVDRIAALAHLALSEDERERFAKQLDGILAYARQVQDVDTSGVPPTTHTLVPAGRLRPDTLHASLPQGQALAGAPEAALDAGFFRVPKVIG
jgi:aspartyl-tRNA(Asn)/glutamyl-tRNA(Gln) amidotransferase subunit C